MRFEFATATRIIFGAGTFGDLERLLPTFGARALVVTGSNPARADVLLKLLDAQKIAHSVFSVSGEPTIDDVQRGTAQARETGSEFVISIGGGAVLDTGKAIAALLTNPGDPSDYLEVIGKGQPIKNLSALFIAIPTTAGTGAEVTSNAVLASPEHKVKVSLRSPLMLPRLALVDSELTHSCPPDVTAYSGLDALTQVIEPYVSNKANPFTDGYCLTGINEIAESLETAYEHGFPEAREAMALGSLCGGIALSNAKLGAVHGFAGPIGGMFDAPHGAICARLLPFVMEANIGAMLSRESQNPALRRYWMVANRLEYLAGDCKLEDGHAWVHRVCEKLEIPPLSKYGIIEADIPAIVEKSAVSSSMQGNPIKLTTDEMHQILARAL